MSDENGGRLAEISPQDVAGYIHDVASQLAHMAREMSLGKLSDLLERAAGEANRTAQGNADPDDAA